MKKIIKLLFFVVFSFCFSVTINADEIDYNDLSPESQQQLDTQKQALEQYCDENKEVKGCIFEKNNSLYNFSTSVNLQRGTDGKDGIGAIYFSVPEGIELIRGYQAFSGYGYGVFAGCYRFKRENGSYNIGKGTYFLFQIIGLQGNKCKVIKSELIPAKGVERYDGHVTGPKRNGNYDGQTAFQNDKVAKYNEWVAVEDGDCPKVFGYAVTVNPGLFSSGYTYYFSNDINDINTLKTYSFFGKEETNLGRPGCTVEDVDGKEKAQQLLNKVLDDINNKACPAKIEDMNSFSDEFENWYENLRTSNEYRVLWSSGLIDEVTHESVEVQINEAIHKKTTDCQYKICNISTSKRSVIESNLGSECRNGCTLSNVKAPSDSPNAKCYCCGGSQGCIYQWTEEGGSTCGLQNNISKDQCIGTSKDLECRKCLVNAYNKANLTDEEKSCMAGSEIAKLLTERNLEESNNEAASADKEREIEENRTIREEIYERLGLGKIPFDYNISTENLTCKEILGDNLVKIVKTSILIVQIVAAIIAIVKAMIVLIPPIISKDADALKKSQSTLITMAIILVIIFTFRPIVKLIGSMLNFDISCIL